MITGEPLGLDRWRRTVDQNRLRLSTQRYFVKTVCHLGHRR